jgi:hypothetical protein
MFIHYIHTNRKAAMVAVVSIEVHFILPGRRLFYATCLFGNSVKRGSLYEIRVSVS